MFSKTNTYHVKYFDVSIQTNLNSKKNMHDSYRIYTLKFLCSLLINQQQIISEKLVEIYLLQRNKATV